MINPFTQVNWKPDTAAKRVFAKSWIIGFPCLALVLFLLKWLKSGTMQPHNFLLLGSIGCALGLILFAIPAIAKPFYVTWYFLACSIGIVVSNVLIVVFYYVAVTGIGLLMRAMGKISFRKGIDKNAKTYWQDVEQTDDPARYYSQY